MIRSAQLSLLAPSLPAGMTYVEEFLSVDEERELLAVISTLPLQQAQYRQYTARRRTLHFGFAYDFTHQRATPAPPIPKLLDPLRARAARFADLAPEDFVQALIAEYQPGAPLGWHRDVPDFEVIVGVSLGSAARLRFRPYPWTPARRKDIFALELAPRSAYVLRAEARWGWQHSVPPVKTLRYSITLRTARARGAEPHVRMGG
jgi:alkylated DNA repair dioxygenase AlkB